MTESLLEISHKELLTVCDLLQTQTGHSFHHYAHASLKRRVERFMNLKRRDANSLIKEISRNKEYAENLVITITVNVTEMFRNPEFFQALPELVFPDFFEQEVLRVWHAGCSSGEEVYSTAILLKEHEFLQKTHLLAWDLNPEMTARAAKGILSEKQLNSYLDAYFLAGGKKHLQDYFTCNGGLCTLKEDVLSHCHFRAENILHMNAVQTFDIIMCRNTLIYFDLSLQDKVMDIFYKNLKPGGYLCLGEKESIRFTRKAHEFEEVSGPLKIFRKKANES